MKDPKKLFDESVDALDAETLSKLNRGRHAALAEVQTERPLWLRWVPAAGVAAAVVVAVMLALPQTTLDATLPASDMDILLGEDSFEMLEDLEFYAWLDMQDGDVG